jgi:elongation factor Tu
VERGVISKGQEVEIVGLGSKMKTVVTGIEMFFKQLDRGEAGDNLGVLLRGVSHDSVKRGMVLAQPGSIKAHQKFKSQLYALTKEEG